MAAVFAIWVFFRAPSLDVAFDVFAALGHFPGGFSIPTDIFGGMAYKHLLVVLLAALMVQRLALPASEAVKAALRARPQLRYGSIAVATIACLLIAFALAPLKAEPFIYFQF
jgi:hypothetical protein